MTRRASASRSLSLAPAMRMSTRFSAGWPKVWMTALVSTALTAVRTRSMSGVAENFTISCVPPENSTPYPLGLLPRYMLRLSMKPRPPRMMSRLAPMKYRLLPRKLKCGFLRISSMAALLDAELGRLQRAAAAQDPFEQELADEVGREDV